EGVLAAAALRCIGGQMQGRLITNVEEQKTRAASMGVKDFNKKFDMSEMASGDVIFAATGVTDGWLLDGIHHERGGVTTNTIVMRSATGTVRRLNSFHSAIEKFT
ncbi:MAG: fructose-bisphosphatase class II, partial [Parvibaculum sp.]